MGVTLVCIMDTYHALVQAPTPARRRVRTPSDWGQSTVPTERGDVRRVGTPIRRTRLARSVCTLGIWSMYCFVRPGITGVFAWIVPFCSTFQLLWLLWMLANHRTVRLPSDTRRRIFCFTM